MMFSLRQLVEKNLERHGNTALSYVGVEKAVDTVPRKMAMATLRWIGTTRIRNKDDRSNV